MHKKEILLWLAAALILAFFVSPFAASSPDGLERVADDKGFLEKGEVEPVVSSPMPDYTWPGIKNEGMATGMAGIFGVLVVFGLTYGIGAMTKR